MTLIRTKLQYSTRNLSENYLRTILDTFDTNFIYSGGNIYEIIGKFGKCVKHELIMIDFGLVAQKCYRLTVKRNEPTSFLGIPGLEKSMIYLDDDIFNNLKRTDIRIIQNYVESELTRKYAVVNERM